MLSDAAALISMTAISSSGTSVSVRMAEDDMDWARSDSTTSRRTIRAKRGVRPGKPGSGPRVRGFRLPGVISADEGHVQG